MSVASCSLENVNPPDRPLHIMGTVLIDGTPLSARAVSEHLPPLLVEIAALIGLDNMLALADTFGGIRFYVPGEPSPDGDLVACIGLDNARALVRHLGPGHITLPKADPLYRFARDVSIRRAHAEQVSCRELARRHRLSERRVWEILAAEHAPSRADAPALA